MENVKVSSPPGRSLTPPISLVRHYLAHPAGVPVFVKTRSFPGRSLAGGALLLLLGLCIFRIAID